MNVLLGNPVRIIPAWRIFLQQHEPDGWPAREIGEHIWVGCDDVELTECQRDESLLNVAFEDGEGEGWRLLCPYDVETLHDRVIPRAKRRTWRGIFHRRIGRGRRGGPDRPVCFATTSGGRRRE
jgi:hypothetical protein